MKRIEILMQFLVKIKFSTQYLIKEKEKEKLNQLNVNQHKKMSLIQILKHLTLDVKKEQKENNL